jgi:PAS domain S-box-containing protein
LLLARGGSGAEPSTPPAAAGVRHATNDTSLEALPELHTAAEVRRLKADQAARHYPVRLRGVVTFFDQGLFSRFVQDITAGIYLGDYPNAVTLPPGQMVEIVGNTSPGEYAPIVTPQSVQLIGTGPLPPAKPVSFEELASGQQDSQLVEVSGIVRSTNVDAETKYLLIDIATGGGRLTAYATNLPPAQTEDLVDCTVRVRGVCSTQFNRRRQLFYIRLLVPRPADFVVEKPAPGNLSTIPAQTIASLLQFTPQGTYGHRVKVLGIVSYQHLGETLFIQDENQGLFVQTRQMLPPLKPGDRVEVLGFPSQGQYTPTLQDAVYRKIHSGFEPEPVSIGLDEVLKGTNDCRLIRLEATLLDRVRYGQEQFLVLQANNSNSSAPTSDFVFHAYNEQEQPGNFPGLENGSRVAVTGVCLIEPGTDWRPGDAWRAKSFRLLLRSSADVALLNAPPWWTLTRLLWMTAVLGVIVLAAFAWVAVLRRRVQHQTEIIRQKLELEAALKERYVDLFENANDIVYTHDLDGRLTSINQAGERILQRGRDEILSRNIVELVVPEQQAAARQWLEQVLKDAAPPTAEWDFTAPSGQPVKLEIGTRLIEENGHQVEVEGIARDITERRRLERELLDISNREQRRIGHDLHDGVCQQLVGISYLTETLADRLQEKGAAESTEAERISYLIKSTLTQTRGVARGLFPVRLEDNGLVSALEELAANAATLFRIPCGFTCEDPPETVDNGIALHLYYIAQEAVANAAKHGQANNVRLTLEPFEDRYAMTIQDDGKGFSATGIRPAGMGLRIMHYRARVIGATLEVTSRNGGGTTIRCLFVPAFSESRKPTVNQAAFK